MPTGCLTQAVVIFLCGYILFHILFCFEERVPFSSLPRDDSGQTDKWRGRVVIVSFTGAVFFIETRMSVSHSRPCLVWRLLWESKNLRQ